MVTQTIEAKRSPVLSVELHQINESSFVPQNDDLRPSSIIQALLQLKRFEFQSIQGNLKDGLLNTERVNVFEISIDQSINE
jgi:hypothetical protein